MTSILKTEKNNYRLEEDADGKPALWMLYQPEERQYKDPNMFLWVRRCNLFLTQQAAIFSLEKLGVKPQTIEQHELFIGLWVITDNRGHKWYLEKGPINV